MRYLRLSLPSVLFAVALALANTGGVRAWENGCPVNLQSDLKRQDLAAAVGLHYYKKRPPGITRTVTTTERDGHVDYDIRYFDPTGAPVTDPVELERIRALKIPPAYSDVWISTDVESHVLAIGYDSRRRPQYAYHPKWVQATSITKFIRMGEFGREIANVRRTILADLHSPGINRRKLLAAAAEILETGSIRVGSEAYRVANGTYGLTTLLHEHVRVEGAAISFDFIGKESIRHRFTLEDPEVAPVIAELLHEPGPRLFEYVDAKGVRLPIDAGAITDYLQEVTGGRQFTPKDFRTWQGTIAAAKRLIELGPAVDAKDAQSKIKSAVEYAASILRNEPGTARENYIHPLVLDFYASGRRFQELADWVEKNPGGGQPLEERFVLELLRRTKP